MAANTKAIFCIVDSLFTSATADGTSIPAPSRKGGGFPGILIVSKHNTKPAPLAHR
jgi:hypothetical protein